MDSNKQYPFRFPEPQKKCVEISDLDIDDSNIILACTQLSEEQYPSQKDKNKVLQDWIKYLEEHPTQFESIFVSTRVNQKLFNALCKQTELKSLYLKWGMYPDISEISRLKKLNYLFLSSGASLKDLRPLSHLTQLEVLVLSAVGAQDHSPLSSLTNLKHLRLDSGMDNLLKIDSLSFIEKFDNLLSFVTTGFRVNDNDFSPILKLKTINYLSVNMDAENDKIWGEKFGEAFSDIQYNKHRK